MTSPQLADAPPAFPRAAPPLILIRDLADQMLWPALLRTPAAALWPSRLVLGVLGALVVGVVGSLSRLWSNAPGFGEALSAGQAEAWGRIGASVLAFRPDGVGSGLRAALLEHPADMVSRYPVSTPILGVVMLAATCAFGGAIARSVAVESATRRRPSAASMLGWSLARLPSTAGGVLGIGAAIALLALLLRGLGWLGFSLGGVDVAAALLAPALGLLGIALMALILGVGLGGAMIVPARVVEDSDAIDAVQRALAYTIARPLRLAVFLGVALGASALGLATAGAILEGGWSLAIDQAQAWLSAPRRDAIAGAGDAPPGAAARILRFWAAAPSMLVAGYAISLFFTGATRVYLAMRSVCDGQDPGEVQGE